MKTESHLSAHRGTQIEKWGIHLILANKESSLETQLSASKLVECCHSLEGNVTDNSKESVLEMLHYLILSALAGKTQPS